MIDYLQITADVINAYIGRDQAITHALNFFNNTLSMRYNGHQRKDIMFIAGAQLNRNSNKPIKTADLSHNQIRDGGSEQSASLIIGLNYLHKWDTRNDMHEIDIKILKNRYGKSEEAAVYTVYPDYSYIGEKLRDCEDPEPEKKKDDWRAGLKSAKEAGNKRYGKNADKADDWKADEPRTKD